MFFNPASLILIEDPQITAGIHIIAPVAEFKNEGSITGFIPGVSPGVPTQGGNATSDDPAVVPNINYSHPLSEDLVVGVGLSSPYGLATSYTDGWVGRYLALDTELQTINLNLALALTRPRRSVGLASAACTATRPSAMLSILDFSI